MITIDRPEALGTLSVQGHIELHNTLLDFRNDELGVRILTSTGEKAFCSGVDIKNTLPAIKRMADKPRELPSPVMWEL